MMTDLECQKCRNTDPARFEPVVASTGYIHRRYDQFRAYGGGHGSAELTGWRCLDCGMVSLKKPE
jgi:hypothetical protein